MQISEIFYSIQGEGILTGLPTVFIRTTGCNLRCTYCDTTYAYQDGAEMSVNQIVSEIEKYHCENICITGGEPLLQDETIQLIHALQEKKLKISLETNGSKPIPHEINRRNLMISMDLKLPSSQMNEQMIIKNIEQLTKNDQLKCVIQNKNDYNYAKKVIIKYLPNCHIIFQPVWGNEMEKLAEWILTDQLSVRMGVQLHKILWGEKTQR
jgi:7-carboxy-7-deazaguanine synthase